MTMENPGEKPEGAGGTSGGITLLLIAGMVIIFAGIIMNLHIYIQPTSLFNTIVTLVLLAGGIGLIARGVRSH